MKPPSRNVLLNSKSNSLGRLTLLLTNIPRLVSCIPVAIGATFDKQNGSNGTFVSPNSDEVHSPLTPGQFYLNLTISVCLVLAGGVFAGLTLGLMGQDEVYLKVIASSGDKNERKYSRNVLKLIGKGKHWVLVTLLLSNVITNETLPIVLDRCLGGGWPAVLASTVSIVIFGEIIPQSICVRYGLQVGSIFAPFVLCLMYIMYPVAYPCALLLDHILGEDHGTMYKKSGLKTLVTLHRTMGVERLNQDEVTIISAVLDLKEKPVQSIMTPIENVFTMSADTILDEKIVEDIFNAGFSRIPIHVPSEPTNFIGMLLVRVLISYDPEDCLPVASFPLATLPETSKETSCLNILNYFQEGKSHMVVVSEKPGEPTGALGVLTLEDVIEELIGEEIVDESDVYVDINKAIKREHPGPLSKRHLSLYMQGFTNNSQRNSIDISASNPNPTPTSNPATSTNNNDNQPQSSHPTNKRDLINSIKPSNLASNPLSTNKSFVTIKKQPAYLGAHPQQHATDSNDLHVVIPPPDIPSTESAGYGSIHVTEEGALKEAQDQNMGRITPQIFVNDKDNEYELTHTNPNSVNSSRSYKSNTSIKSVRLPNKDIQETRNYRTGGIIESIINVKGVHKTIIENVSDHEYDNYSDIENDENELDINGVDYYSDEGRSLLKKKKKNRRG